MSCRSGENQCCLKMKSMCLLEVMVDIHVKLRWLTRRSSSAMPVMTSCAGLRFVPRSSSPLAVSPSLVLRALPIGLRETRSPSAATRCGVTSRGSGMLTSRTCLECAQTSCWIALRTTPPRLTVFVVLGTSVGTSLTTCRSWRTCRRVVGGSCPTRVSSDLRRASEPKVPGTWPRQSSSLESCQHVVLNRLTRPVLGQIFRKGGQAWSCVIKQVQKMAGKPMSRTAMQKKTPGKRAVGRRPRMQSQEMGRFHVNGVASVPRRPMTKPGPRDGMQISNPVRCLDATHQSHLTLPISIGPYAVVRTTSNVFVWSSG